MSDKSEKLHFQQIFDDLQEGCQILDFNLKYIYLNKAAENHNRRSNKELLGNKYEEMWPERKNTRMYKLITNSLIERIPNYMENEVESPDGEKDWFEIRISPIPEGISIISLDITKRKLLAAKLLEAEEKKHHAQKIESIGHLAGGIAHDFNNNLTIILGYVELALSMNNNNHELQKNLQQIKKAAFLSSKLTQQLLGFARKQNAIPQIINIDDEIAKSLSFLKRIVGENINISCHSSKNIYPVKIDPNQLNQILTNLSVNSKDAIHNAGEIIIDTQNITIDNIYFTEYLNFKPGKYALISFSDNGSGINDQDKKQIFEPFFTTKEQGNGTGLGLSTIYGIMRQNNGYVHVYSELGNGTTFKLYFPCSDENENDNFLIEEEKVLNEHETILLVDDEPDVLVITKILLKDLGYNVIDTNDPLEALDIVKEFSIKIDLLMTDVVMPKMTGAELSKKVSDINPNIKILFLSGYTANIIEKNGLINEKINLLSKPFSKTQLNNKIRSILNK